MDIVLYLTALLESRKMVGIAGLGTLYKKKSPGRYDATQHVFVPPSFTLAFTSEIKESDELANYICEDRHISIDSANYFINEFTDQILAQLANRQQARLGAIGLLKVIDNELVLVPEENENVGHDNYGLPTVADIEPITNVDASPTAQDDQLEAIEQENRLEEENPGSSVVHSPSSITATADEQPVFEEISDIAPTQKTWEIERTPPPLIETAEQEEKEVEDEQNIPTENETKVISVVETKEVETDIEPKHEAEINTEEIEETPKQGTSLLLKVLIVLAVILLVGAIAYFVNPKFFDQYIQNNHQEQPQINLPVAPTDSLATNLDTAKKDTVPSTPIRTLTEVKKPSGIDSTKLYYEVIATSYQTKAAADAYIAKLASFGIKATIANMEGKRFNVSVGTFSDPKPAYQLKDSLLHKYKGIYIKPIKPKKHTN